MNSSDVGTTSQAGQWVALAGLLGLVLSHFGINILPADIETLVSATIVLYGVVHSLIAHNNLKTIAGMN